MDNFNFKTKKIFLKGNSLDHSYEIYCGECGAKIIVNYFK